MAAHAMVHTYELSIPVLVPIWLEQFQVSPFVLSLVVSVGYGLFGLGSLPAGVLADTYDARTLIVGCLVGMGGSFLALTVAPSLWLIGVALLFWGVAASVYHPSGLSLISRGVEKRGTAFAYHGMAGNLGIALGPFVTLLLLLAFDWRIAVGLLALPAGAAALYATTVDIDERAAARAADGGADDRATGGITSLSGFLSTSRTLLASTFAVVFVLVMFSGLYYRGTLTFLPEILRDVPVLEPVTIGGREYTPGDYVYVGLLMVGVFGQFVGGKLTDRMPVEYGLLAGFASLTVVALLFVPATAVGLAAILVVAAALGFSLFFVQPFYQATVAEYSPAEARGLSYGFTYLGTFGVGALGAVVAGAALTFLDPTGLFVVLAGLAAVAAALAGVLVRRERPA
ncbi:MFS transporter [Halobacteriales archaeon QS_1_68_17]|nr:MAG: MFS transporter [Halobacteriales archaeon QS_1_68_17]